VFLVRRGRTRINEYNNDVEIVWIPNRYFNFFFPLLFPVQQLISNKERTVHLYINILVRRSVRILLFYYQSRFSLPIILSLSHSHTHTHTHTHNTHSLWCSALIRCHLCKSDSIPLETISRWSQPKFEAFLKTQGWNIAHSTCWPSTATLHHLTQDHPRGGGNENSQNWFLGNIPRGGSLRDQIKIIVRKISNRMVITWCRS